MWGIFRRLANLRQVPVKRHWRRLQARWRLHRMEWDGRGRPLEPPPGYEHYYTKEEMFPGFKHRPLPSKNLKEFGTRLARAWKFYRHHYVHDPEMAEIIQKLEKSSIKFKYDMARHSANESEANWRKESEKASKLIQKIGGDAKVEFDSKRPEVEQILKDRTMVLKDALGEFAIGYKEGVSGPLEWLNMADFDDDSFEVPSVDNMPVRYEAHHTTTPPAPSTEDNAKEAKTN